MGTAPTGIKKKKKSTRVGSTGNQTFDYNLQKCKHLSLQPTAFNIKHPGMVWVHEEILKTEEDILSFKEAALSAWIEHWPAGHLGKSSPQMKDHLTKWFENSLWWTVTNNSMGGKEEQIGSLDRKDDSCGQQISRWERYEETCSRRRYQNNTRAHSTQHRSKVRE